MWLYLIKIIKIKIHDSHILFGEENNILTANVSIENSLNKYTVLLVLYKKINNYIKYKIVYLKSVVILVWINIIWS